MEKSTSKKAGLLAVFDLLSTSLKPLQDILTEQCLSSWFLIYQQEILSFTHDVADFLVRVYLEENPFWTQNHGVSFTHSVI